MHAAVLTPPTPGAATHIAATQLPHKNQPGVFPWSSEWFRNVTEFAHSSPAWLQEAVLIGTEAGLLVFPVLFIAASWRARRLGARQMTLAILAPLVTANAYVISESIKSTVLVVRPCRAVAHVATLAECPPPEDWSFPSNHATVAAAAATAVVLAWRALGYVALPTAALIAFSRVFIGVHYPLDVIVGFMLGVTVALLLSLTLTRLLAPLIAHSHQSPPRHLLTEASKT